MKGRPRDPKRAKRQTGHRTKPGEAAKLRVLPVPVAEPDATLELPAPPAHLSKEGKEVWGHVVEALTGGGIPVRPLDALSIEMIVRSYLRVVQAGKLVDDYGMVAQTTSGDVTVTPFSKAERDWMGMFLRYAEQYGLALGARMRLGLMAAMGKSLTQGLAEDLER